MRFLADESCDFSVVRALRAAGHDVAAVAEIAPRADDAAVVQMALSESRVLLTEDRDFGRLVYAEGQPSSGVVLIRFPAAARATLPDAILSLVQAHGQVLEGCFVVVSPTRVRISRTPSGSSDVAVESPQSGPGGTLASWRRLQEEIAACRECCERWPHDVRNPLAVGEIPDPPERIDILFVGVAPTRPDGSSRGQHFYSDQGDLLRQGLFKLLSEAEFGLELTGLSLHEGDRVFHRAGCFFLHAAKIRPVNDDAPPGQALVYCADRHLRHEIVTLGPRAVCFLGTTNLDRVAEKLFGREIPYAVSLGNWSGNAIVTHQPLRGWTGHTRNALRRLWRG